MKCWFHYASVHFLQFPSCQEFMSSVWLEGRIQILHCNYHPVSGASAVYSKTLQELAEGQMIKKDKYLKDNKARGLQAIFSWTNNYFLLRSSSHQLKLRENTRDKIFNAELWLQLNWQSASVVGHINQALQCRSVRL